MYSSIAVPSQPPTSLSVTAKTSTSVTASWQLPPADSRNGIIIGFKLFHKKKGSSDLPITVPINSASTLTKDVYGLAKFTEYEFQVLAFTSAGDGPKSSVETMRTKEDGKKSKMIVKQGYVPVYSYTRLSQLVTIIVKQMTIWKQNL